MGHVMDLLLTSRDQNKPWSFELFDMWSVTDPNHLTYMPLWPSIVLVIHGGSTNIGRGR
jgi:hypothetical protein